MSLGGTCTIQPPCYIGDLEEVRPHEKIRKRCGNNTKIIIIINIMIFTVSIVLLKI